MEPQLYEEEPELRLRLSAVVGDCTATTLSETLREKVNTAARGAFAIDWWGTFEELRGAGSEWARDLREKFREMSSEDSSGRPSADVIQDAELDDFVEFVQSYGH